MVHIWRCRKTLLKSPESCALGATSLDHMVYISNHTNIKKLSKQNVIPWTESAILWQILCWRIVVLLVLVVSILLHFFVVDVLLFFCIGFCNISFCINKSFCSAGNFCCFPLETRCRNRRFLKIIQVIMICSVASSL